MSEVVRGELRLPSLGDQGPVLDGHDSGVVDEQVQRPGPRFGEGGHGPEVGQFERPHIHIRAACVGRHLLGDLLAGVCVPYGEGHLRAPAGKRANGLHADT